MEGSDSVVPLSKIIGIVACIIGSAFFSGSETALTRITTTRANILIHKAPSRYGILKVWLDSKKRILSMLLVGNNIVNILCSILAYRLAVQFFPNYAEAISVFGLTLIILIFAEITPKSLAMHHAERIAVPLLRVIWLLDKLMFPIAWPLSKIPNLISGSDNDDDDDAITVTEDEIEYHIRQGVDQAVFAKKEKGELLISAMEFSDIMTKEIMIPRTDIVGLEKITNLKEALDMVIESGHSRVPVYEQGPDKIVGVLHAKDMLAHIKQHSSSSDISVSEVMRKEILFVPETQKITSILTDMRRRGMHMAAVVDEFGGTAGLVTLEDIIEELVGEIRDEFDPEKPMLQTLSDHRWLVDARLSIHDFEDSTGIALPDTGDYESVGGLVIALNGRIPRRGKVIEIDDLSIIIVDSDATHVKRLEIRRQSTTNQNPRNDQ